MSKGDRGERPRPRVDPAHAVLALAFTRASSTGEECRPVHLLAALSESDGPVAAALRRPDGTTLFAPLADPLRNRGGSCGYLALQTQQMARQFADVRAQTVAPVHLLLAVLDQGDPEVLGHLRAAGLDPTQVRARALAALGAPPDQPPIDRPSLIPAGTMDRPPLPVDDLDPRAWAVLSWRQAHLPLDRLRRPSDWAMLSLLEQRAAWTAADRAGVDDDQRYSLIAQHGREVERRARLGPPTMVARPEPARGPKSGWVPFRRGRRWLPRWLRHWLMGWPSWFGNRRTDLQYTAFRLRTIRAYRGGPQL